jgi:hypothetical protein
MALLEELKERWERTLAELKAAEDRVEDLSAQMNELDIAVCSLEEAAREEPAPIPEPAPALPSMDDIIDPDLTGGMQTEEFLDKLHADEPDDASEFAEPDDEAKRAAAIELTADIEPVAASWIDQQTCEPVDATLRAFQDDHIVEPQPTEGYAPVTNPEAHIQAVEAERYAQPTNSEADFWARGLAPSEPEKKHRFSIFGHKRETEEVS